MAFIFNWPEFGDAFVERARAELELALNRGSKPSNICDTIRVTGLHMGAQPPDLDIMEIGELNEEKFRGIFKLTYSGDAHVLLQTKVQANPLTVGEDGARSGLDALVGPTIVAADAPLIVPLELRISDFKIRGIFVLIVSLVRGVTISFKNDPLESVTVSSTFDNVPSVRRHLQREIEQRLSNLFREELPLLVHHLSLSAIRSLAERIPPPFRSAAPPPGFFRHRRAASVAATPSRTGSPVSVAVAERTDSAVSFDEIYYFRRNSMIHRTVGKGAICDPLAGPVIIDLTQQRRKSSVLEEISGMVERIPLLGEEAKEFFDRVTSPRSRATNISPLCGLKDPILFQTTPSNGEGPRSRYGSTTLVINGGSLTIDLSRDAVESLSNEPPPQRRPSVYKAPRSEARSESGDGLDVLDPDEFRSVDSLALRPTRGGGGELPPPKTNITLGRVALQRSVQRSSLPGRLSILRTLYENPSPFSFDPDGHVVYRSMGRRKDSEMDGSGSR